MTGQLMDIRLLFAVVSVFMQTQTFTDRQDYGGFPFRVDRFLREPTVFTLRDRKDHSWSQMIDSQNCHAQCDCPIQWPTAFYCDHKGLEKLPEGFLSNSEYLFLQGNNITGVDSGVFINATNLRWLFLDNNQLLSQTFDGRMLSNLTQLVNLFMNYNNLTEVPVGLPRGLKQLRLAYNHIEDLSNEAFKDLQNLTLLLLRGNQLKSIGEDNFKGLSVLTLLDLSHNLMDAFPKHLPPSLQQLYLIGNSLTHMSEDSLSGFNGLCYLRLSHNRLKSDGMSSGAFNVTSLVELDLSYNQLTEIPVVPTTLQYLYLEVNDIREFNITSLCRTVDVTTYSQLKLLRLDGNKLTYQQLPSEWVYCLRDLQDILI